MEKETFIITTGEHSSCLKENKWMSPECVSVNIGNPESVTVLEGHPRLYTEEEFKVSCEAAQDKAWSLAWYIINSPEFGTDFISFGGWKSQSDIFNSSYEHVRDTVNKWFNRVSLFDIVTVTFDDGVYEEAVVTRVDGIFLDLLCKGGRTTYRNMSEVNNTGRTFEHEDAGSWNKWLKGE